jgi:immunity protein 27 of polymorphic toxin system
MKHQELQPDETDIVGRWLERGSKVVGDPTCQRIWWLVAERLELLADSADGWDKLYRDPRDRRLWEHTYPQSEMRGGGPPRLTNIGIEEAHAKYGDRAG